MAFADLVPEEYRGVGLSAGELDAAQEQIGVIFPPDLCELRSESMQTNIIIYGGSRGGGEAVQRTVTLPVTRGIVRAVCADGFALVGIS